MLDEWTCHNIEENGAGGTLDLQKRGREFIQQLELWKPRYAEPRGESELKRASDDLVSLTGRAEICAAEG